MATEFIMLAFSIALGLAHVLLSGHARLERAMRNYLETFTFFAATVMLTHTIGGRPGMMAAGSEIYFFSRLVYLPLYAFGVPLLRTVVWNVSVLGIVLVLLSIL